MEPLTLPQLLKEVGIDPPLAVPPRPALVHTRQLTVEDLQPDAPESDLHFRQHRRQRAFWRAVLLNWHGPYSLCHRFEHCGSSAWVWYSAARKEYRVRADYCNCRFCPVCGPRRSQRLASRIAIAIGQVAPNEWKFITLTLKHSNAPLAEQLDWLRSSFRRLRQRALWRHRVTGGYAFLEVTWNTQDEQWHPHMHVLCRCKYIPRRDLSALWFQVTKGSMVSDIRVVRSAKGAAFYVTKYAGKTPDLTSVMDLERALDYLEATRKSRLYIAFGDVERPPPFVPPDDGLPNDWESHDSLSSVFLHANRGDFDAKRVLNCLYNQQDHDPLLLPDGHSIAQYLDGPLVPT